MGNISRRCAFSEKAATGVRVWPLTCPRSKADLTHVAGACGQVPHALGSE